MYRYKIIALNAFIILFVSCATPKVAEIKKIDDLPQAYSEANATASNFEGVTLKSFFTDPHLLDLYDRAVKANPDYQIAEQRIEIANSFLRRSKLQILPSLELGAIASGNRYGKYTIDGVGNYDTNLSSNISEDQKVNESFTPNYWLGLQSSWEADVWGKLRNQKRAAQKRFLASHEGLRMLQLELFTDISSLYYELIGLDRQLEIYKENYELQQRAFEIISAQRVVGKSTELAVQQLHAQNKNLQAEIEHLKAEIIVVEKAIHTLLGNYNGTIERSNELLPSNSDILNQSINVDAVIHSRPDVKSNYLMLEASQADAKAARAAFYPRLSLEAGIGYNSFSTPTLFKPGSLAFQVLGGLMTPIFNKGQIKHEFSVSKAEQEIAFLNYQKSITTAFNELQSVLKQIDIYERVLTLKAEEVQHLNLAVEVSNDLYLTGYANYLELINSQKTKLQADLDYLRFQQENARNHILIFKALGGTVN
jgi:multidrug efflux system outer membrane protein